MSKRRDALRRGIRSLLHDTSRELADLEGREAPAEGPEADPAGDRTDPGGQAGPPADGPRGDAEDEAPGDATVEAEVVLVEVREFSQGAAAVEPEPAAPADARGVPGAIPPGEKPEDAGAAASDEIPGDPAEAVAEDAPCVTLDGGTPGSADPGATAPASEGHGVVAGDPSGTDAGADVDAAAAEEPAAGEAVPADEVVVETGPPARAKARGRRRTGAARRRPAPRPTIEEPDPIQARARKGVCVAYFVDHECWRVPDAYCNTALHVCVMRDCPVYHLHQEALERRFAGKYKHLW